MSKEELLRNIRENKIPDHVYSLDEGVKPNAYVLIKNYDKWEYMFIDERGGRNNEQVFYVASEAFDFFWKVLLKEIKTPPSTRPSGV